ncbi:MAG: helix-turn-helix transcriptional regulator [Robiginitomaculum sp.]|nr:helix-turn-helix transcriptional regulator [Robiginitomaculum sp.]
MSTDGTIIGLTGISQDLRSPDMHHSDFSMIGVLLSHVKENLSQPPTIKELSQLACLTPYQLDRRIHRLFGLTTGQWVLKQRLDLARHQLLGTDIPIAEIALNVGYSDQSTFARQFRKTAGFTPSGFRQVRTEKRKI